MDKSRRSSSGSGRRSKPTPAGKQGSIPAIVTAVILDEESQAIEDSLVSPIAIGAIQFKILGKGGLSDSGGGNVVAYPLYPASFTLPLKNEIVDLLKIGSTYRYQRRTNGEFQNFNSSETALDDTYAPRKVDSNPKGGSDGYQSTSNTGISNSTAGGETEGYGEYFTPSETIHRLKLYEGETLIQSRFGQSIRFSGYNNEEGTFSPTIILRNRENDTSQNDTEFGSTTEEDVNRDGSTIVLSSADYKLDFQPGVIDDGGSSNFEQKPNSFEEYPSELTGDQILINSGRIILSAKDSEMIFYSKGNYGFISDSTLSIDNKGGMTVNTDDDVLYLTNGSNYTIETETGEIHLGNGGSEEPLVLGDTLVELLNELCTELQSMTHPTPAGPSGPPVNAPKFAAIASKLSTILSTKNFVD